MDGLVIQGKGTPRHDKKQISSSQKEVNHPFAASAVITKNQMEVMRKLASLENTHIPKQAQKENAAAAQKEDKFVPKLRLDQIKRNDEPSYYVTEGVASSRTVLSWGGDTMRQEDPHPPDVPPLPTRGEPSLPPETARVDHTTARPGADLSGEFEGQQFGCEHFESVDDKIKRERQEGFVKERMIMDLTQPETESEPSTYSVRTPWATAEREDFYALNDMPKIKRLNSKLHSTSSELTFSDLKNRGLDKRLMFRVRFITRSNRESLKDLYGFYFPIDNSLTVYEYREIGRKYTAAVIFKRDVYHHASGRWRGNAYNLRDLKIGHTLYLPTKGNTALPEAIRGSPLVPLRITSLKHDHVIELICDGCRIEERNDRIEAFTQPDYSKEDVENARLIRYVQERVRSQFASRPIKYFVNLREFFHEKDINKDGVWRRDELESALKSYRLKLDYEDFLVLWGHLDQDRSGVVDLGEFIRGLVGEVNEARFGVIRRAWSKVDPSCTGTTSPVTIRHFYNPVISLNPNEEESGNKSSLMEEFLDTFSIGGKKQTITFSEFLDYHTAISLTEASDEVFARYMKTCWNV